MGHGRGLAWGLGGGSEICVDSEFVDPAGSSSGNAKVVVAIRRGGGPGFWRDVRGLRAVVWVARAMRRLGRAALRLVCGFGAE